MSRVTPGDLGLGNARFRVRDLAREAWLSVTGHPARSLLTAIGTVLGAAAFVATLGLSATVSAQVSDSFDVRRATEVVVRAADERDTGPPATSADPTPSWQTRQARQRLVELNGVEAAGSRVLLPEQSVRRTADSAAAERKARVIGMDSGAFGVIEPHVVLGRTFDAFHDRTAAPVALLPANIADGLGITRVGVAVFVGDRAYTVIGIFDDVARHPEALLSVLIPFDTANPSTGGAVAGVERDLVIRTAPGAAQLIGSQAALALAPENPAALLAVAPPDPATLRREVEGDVAQLSLILSLVALAIGTVSIANAATAGIAARIPEIGLRRAVGARPRHIFSQLLAETTVLGALGGLIGAVGGVLITIVVSLTRGWQPIIDVPTALLASSAGALAGLLAGLLPAWRATRIQPVSALQR
ncbi:ABC transporter permease [Actinophytocola sp.]|uniref:ABC transporter permease n=1 Tax=Actinophytocola sp. TaxID=1872138 RepID=UPI002ECFE2C3